MIPFRFPNLIPKLKVGRESPTAVFSINMQPQSHSNHSLPIENAVVKLETPLGNPNDYKIEQVKVTMLVKDEKSNDLKEIAGELNL